MRIKKLEISGFKSFAERARLHFGEGITGVVGPNGCGKSNVVDAIRWCMGEMSVKHLRGRAMQDVIFAGSDGRGAQGMAEVTLTFDNDGNVPPSYLDYSEISVTRRLFRDGTSEYLLNKTPVRLRDITDLFLGTGVGTRAYSIIEQGRIGFVVNSRPEERRSLIEEVAGITKFKARKKIAERRMQSTEQNLARVGDVISELERQLQTLRRQAKKAERYRELRAEQRDVELHTAVLDMMEAKGKETLQQREQARIEAAIADSQTTLSAEEAELDADRLKLLDESQQLQHMQAHSTTLDNAVTACERDVLHWREQAQAEQERETQREQELTEARARAVRGEEELTRLREEASALETGGPQDDEALDALQDTVEQATQILEELDAELDALRQEAIVYVQGSASYRAQLSALSRQGADLSTRARRAQAELEALLPEQSVLEARAAELAQRDETLRAHLTEHERVRAELDQKLPEQEESFRELRLAAEKTTEELRAKKSRLASLSQVARRLEGYGDGVRTLLKDASQIAGFLGMVNELLSVPPLYETAIEAALGDRLQYLVVEELDAAREAVARLRRDEGGRGGFVPRTLCRPSRPLGAPPTGAGVVALGRDIVEVPEALAFLRATLVDPIVVVESLSDAEALRENARDYVFVTRTGEVMSQEGLVTGGSVDGAGILQSRREIRELTEEVEVLAEQQASTDTARDDARATLEASRKAREAAHAEVHRVTLEKTRTDKDCEAARVACARAVERIDKLRSEAESAAESAASIQAELEQAEADAEAAEASKEDVDWRLSDLGERRALEASKLSRATGETTTLRVALASKRERAEAAERAVVRAAEGQAELHTRIERLAGGQKVSNEDVLSLRARIEEGVHKAEALSLEAESARATLSEARAAFDAMQETISAREQTLKTGRRGSENLSEQLLATRVELERLGLLLSGLDAQVRERHDVALAQIVPDYHMRPLLTPSERKRANDLERQIRAIGPVNLTAIDECAEVETRYSFLAGQRDDLADALKSLRDAIARINKTSRERFHEAFHSVNEMFQKVYPRLFRGGSARLELTETQDLLEAGVDIIAMPPGKKLQNVTLLSGGEKALTATALIFAIFLIKPSPFCILDEVDAPLDEANVGRFNEMLREISKVSQFIVITHNKQTMIQADKLYGITMETAGMSKVVSVDLDNKQDEEEAA